MLMQICSNSEYLFFIEQYGRVGYNLLRGFWGWNMFKKFNFLLVFLFLILTFMFSHNEAKASVDKTKIPANYISISKLIAKQKQDLQTNAVNNKLITSETSTITNGTTNTTSKIIKNPDVNFNFIIDIQDLAGTARLYNVKNNSGAFDSKFDLNDDGIIDIYDLVLQSKHLGSSINMPSVNMETYVGDMFNMPSSLEATISDGYLTNVKTSWTNSSISTSAEAVYSLSGQLTDYKKSVTAQVKVAKRTQNYNSMNYGLAAVYNNKVYYSNPANNFYLSRSDLDGNYVVKICNDSAFYINVVNDWIYYVNASDNNAIYKIKIDGTGRTKIVSDKAEFMNISDGWIYYSNGSDYYTIYQVRVDGTQRTKLNDLTSLYIYLYGDEIYFTDYSTYSDGVVYGNLCSIKKDGTGYKDLTYVKTGPNVRIGNAIYFLDEWDELLYTPLNEPGIKYSINGANGSYTGINTDGKYLYVSTGKSIYKYDPSVDTFPEPQISTGGYINISTGNIFAFSDSLGYYMTQTSLQTMSSKIFGVDSVIKKLHSTTDKVYQYDRYAYPNKIIAERLDGTIFPVGVSWDNRNVNSANFGSFNLSGTVAGFGSKAALTVNVVDRGNLNQNLYWNNHFAQKGDWTYFSSPLDKKLYKIKNDGSGRTKLSDDNAFSINVIGDYVYYINEADDYIYKIKSDGTLRTKLYPQNHYDKMITDGNKIYLQKYDGIYSINMDASDPQKVVEANSNSIIRGSMALVGNYIIYSDNGIYAATLDGSYKVSLLNDDTDFITDGRYLFFQVGSTDAVHRFDMETGEQKDLNIASDRLISVFNDRLYYSKSDGIYECDINGLNDKKISNIQSYVMYAAQTGLYIEDQYNTQKIYKCGFDGENLTEFGGETRLKYTPLESVIIPQGTAYSLPKTIMVTMIDGGIKEISVQWDNNQINTSVLGTYTYEGTLDGYPDKASLELIISPGEVYGNDINNKSNNCFVAKYGDWIIYSNKSDSSALYKMKSDGTSKIKITSNPSSNINTYGDWIYYTSSGKIRRIKADGTYDTVVANGTVVTFRSGWIYYLNNNKLYKARVDGCESTVLLDNVMQSIIDDTAIYYKSTDNKFYKADFNGINNVLVSDLIGHMYNFNGDYIYFSTYYQDGTYNGYSILKMKKDGTGLTMITKAIANAIFVNNNYIFSIYSGGGLYRTDLNGNGKTLISSINAYDINIIDGWIYYQSDTANCRIKLDGTGQETF